MRNAVILALAALGLSFPSTRIHGGEEIVEKRREWLTEHQSPDGSWDPVGFDERCMSPERCQGKGRPEDRVGTTALAVLSFLGYGVTPGHPHYGKPCRMGLDFLVKAQDAEGFFGKRDPGRAGLNHAQAAFALVEATPNFKDETTSRAARMALDALGRLRVPGQGWGLAIGAKETDLETSAWAVLALHAARSAGLRADGKEFPEVLAWLDTKTDPATGRVGPKRTEGPERETAMAACIRVLAGQVPAKAPLLQKGVEVMLASVPRWDDDHALVDFVYWWFGTEACNRVGGATWKRWTEAMKRAVIDPQHQVKGECRYGSWDPVGPSAPEGRVAATAYGNNCMVVYYRYSAHDHGPVKPDK